MNTYRHRNAGKVEEGVRKVEEGDRKVEEGGRKVQEGGRKVAGRSRKVEEGARKVLGRWGILLRCTAWSACNSDYCHAIARSVWRAHAAIAEHASFQPRHETFGRRKRYTNSPGSLRAEDAERGQVCGGDRNRMTLMIDLDHTSIYGRCRCRQRRQQSRPGAPVGAQAGIIMVHANQWEARRPHRGI